MSARFEKFLPFVFKWECVYDRKGNVIAEEVPGDAGGVTKWGIDHGGHPELSPAKIRSLTKEEATAIYLAEWNAHKCESLPEPLGEVFFNATVNCGAGRAAKLLDLAKGSAGRFLDEQEGFYQRLAEQKPGLQKFLKGWLNRTAALRVWIGQKPAK